MKLSNFQKHILKILVPLWLILLSTIWIVLQKLLPIHKLNEINGLIWAKIASILFVTIIFLSFYIFLLHKKIKQKPNMKNYSFIDPPGYYSHKKHGGKFCQHCLLTEPYIESPLHIDVNYLKCNICDKSIDNPDYKPPSFPEPKNLGPHGWMAK